MDLYELRLVRYHHDEEWSPWNCIMLTHQEAEIHSRLDNLFKVYKNHLKAVPLKMTSTSGLYYKLYDVVFTPS